MSIATNGVGAGPYSSARARATRIAAGGRYGEPMDEGSGRGEQLELTLGPLYVVVVDEDVSAPLTGRAARSYRSPPQPLEDARALAALLLDRGAELSGDGPWRRPLAGGHRRVTIVAAGSPPLGA